MTKHNLNSDPINCKSRLLLNDTPCYGYHVYRAHSMAHSVAHWGGPIVATTVTSLRIRFTYSITTRTILARATRSPQNVLATKPYIAKTPYSTQKSAHNPALPVKTTLWDGCVLFPSNLRRHKRCSMRSIKSSPKMQTILISIHLAVWVNTMLSSRVYQRVR
jgi:hypothetical protein